MTRVLRLLFTIALSIVVLAAPTFAADTNGDGLETILLPFAFRPGAVLQGAYGTKWEGEVWIHNRRNQTVSMQLLLGCPFLCSAQYQPNFVGRLTDPLSSVPEERGILLTPRADDAPFIALSNRIFEVTRHAQPQGIEVPIVREGQFLTSVASLLGIRNGTGARSALRVYDPRRIQGTTILVEVLDDNSNVVGATRVVTSFGTEGGNAAIQPGFAMIPDLGSTFPAVTALDHFHLRLTPVTPNAEYWAMVSVTDNDTQQVLLITPQ